MKRSFLLIKLFSIGFVFSLAWAFFVSPNLFAAGESYTVCPVGCDFLTLTDALLEPGIGDDTIILTEDYVFVDLDEQDSLSIPDGIAIVCAPGAGKLGGATDTVLMFFGGENTSFEGCTFENVQFDISGKSGFSFTHNTFSPDALSVMILTHATDVTITDNIDIQKIQIQTADDVLIENNSFACRFESTCLNAVTAGAPDLSDDADISNNLIIRNNTIVNHKKDNGGDWVHFWGGRDIEFTGNTVYSAVTLDENIYLTVVTVTGAQIEFRDNFIITPEKDGAQTSATWAFNLRVQEYAIDVLFDHNTILHRNTMSGADGNACFGLYDQGGNPNLSVTITATYNLCHQVGTTQRGRGIYFSYDIGSVNPSLNDSWNGFSNIATPISDDEGIITTLDGTTVLRNALLRLEDPDPSNHGIPNPVSTYLDVNGTNDIGAWSGARVTTILVDDGCVVDYTTCHGNGTDFLRHALRDGDTAYLADGIYSPVVIQGFDNISLVGSSGTIIDALGGGFGLVLENISNSSFQGIRVEQASSTSTTHTITMPGLSMGGTDYTAFPGFILLGNDCNVDNLLLPSTPTDISGVTGVGTEDFVLMLIHLPPGIVDPDNDAYITALVRTSLISVPGDLTTLCGMPESFIDVFLNPGFSLSDGVYNFNATDFTDEGITTVGGAPLPSITTVTLDGIGLILDNVSNTTFTDFVSTDSRKGVIVQGGSDGNTFIDSDLTGNTTADIHSISTGDTILHQTLFTLANTLIDDSGIIIVSQDMQVHVEDSQGAPLSGAQVTFTDKSSNVTGPLTTDGAGDIPITSIPLYFLNQANPTNPLANTNNPYQVSVTKAGYTPKTTGVTITSGVQLLTVVLATQPSSGGTTTGGGGGVFIPAPVVPEPTSFLKGDLNNDGLVNLIDFSIAAFWYRKSLSDAFKVVELERLNGDGAITLVDFSIMAFYWTKS